MSYSSSVSEAIKRIRCRDSTLKIIYLFGEQLADSNLAELADCLLDHPDAVVGVYMSRNQLTDETGVKLARYVAASTTIKSLTLENNCIDLTTYLALAAAVQFNSSLRFLYLNDNQAVDQVRVDAMFVDALRVNPNRRCSHWRLYLYGQNDFKRLKHMADDLGHPTLQMILNHELEKKEIKSIKRVL